MSAEPSRSVAWRLWRRYRLRVKRRYLIARAIRNRRQLGVVVNRTARIAPGDILCFATMRNEADRVAHWLDHHRRLGVSHFLVTDNGSTDGTAELLAMQPDVSLWETTSSYKAARFGMDWVMWLMWRHGAGHWCLTLDADELFLPPHPADGVLRDLTGWLDDKGARAMGAIMLDLYPKGRLGTQDFTPGEDPLAVLPWFDAGGIQSRPRPDYPSEVKFGGVRGRVFFADAPERSPTLNKVPLVKWSRRYAYVSSTHFLLPPWLNAVERRGPVRLPSAVLLHTKFLPAITRRAREEKYRAEHFSNSALFDAYYDALAQGPTLWTENSVRYRDWRQLQELGLMTQGDWRPAGPGD